MSIKLKPCPFCSGEAYIHGDYNGYEIKCVNDFCGCVRSSPNNVKKRDAIKAWNNRTPEPVTVSLGKCTKRLKQYYETWDKNPPIGHHKKGIAKAVLDSLKAQGADIEVGE